MSRIEPFVFDSGGQQLCAMLHVPESAGKRGVIVITGGPTYRVGPHRSNYQLGIELAEHGVTTMRFDFHGAGDSDGGNRTPRRSKRVMDDIRGAIDQMFARVPELEEVVLWGLCRGAIRALEYAAEDPRVSAIVLLNPRVDNDRIDAVASIKHYYWKRATNPDLYRKILRGGFNPLKSAREIGAILWRAVLPRGARGAADSARGEPEEAAFVPIDKLIEDGFARFRGRYLLILGDEDLESAKFKEILKRSPSLQRRIEDPEIDLRHLPGATHTFNSHDSLNTVIAWTRDWVASA